MWPSKSKTLKLNSLSMLILYGTNYSNKLNQIFHQNIYFGGIAKKGGLLRYGGHNYELFFGT